MRLAVRCLQVALRWNARIPVSRQQRASAIAATSRLPCAAAHNGKRRCSSKSQRLTFVCVSAQNVARVRHCHGGGRATLAAVDCLRGDRFRKAQSLAGPYESVVESRWSLLQKAGSGFAPWLLRACCGQPHVVKRATAARLWRRAGPAVARARPQAVPRTVARAHLAAPLGAPARFQLGVADLVP
jgi:hypothetical protein